MVRSPILVCRAGSKTMITIKTTADHEITVQTPFSPALRDACKSIPGRAWDPDRQAWVYPATPLVAKEIADRFTGQSCCTDDEFDKLVERGRNGTRLPDGQSLMPATAVPPPDSKTDCYRHQLVAYGNLLTRPANLLAHHMGVGKSKVVVDAVVNLPDVNLVLIVCPKTVIDVWPEQFAEHAATPVTVIPLSEGTVATRTSKAKQQIQIHQARQHPEPLVLVINYEAVWAKAFAEFALGVAWDMVVCDEIHRIKSARGVASRFLAQLAKLAVRRVGLTGTPFPHSQSDIFAQFRFLDVGIFGKYVTRFRSRYIEMGGYKVNGRCVQEVGMKNVDEFNRNVASITHFVTKEDAGLDLPPVVHQTRYVTLGPDAARAYRDLERDLVTQVEAGLVTVANAMVMVTKLQQVTSGFLRIDREETRGEIVDAAIGNEKAAALAELFDDLPPAERVVVFCRFLHDLDVIAEAAKKCKRLQWELSGRRNELAHWQTKNERLYICGRCKNRDALPYVGKTTPCNMAAPGDPGHCPGTMTAMPPGDVLAVQIQAGGVGIDLTRAAYCCYFSPTYNMGDYLQSLARLDRPGQTRPVTYIHLVAKGTIDETVYKALQSRQDVITAVIEGIKNETR